jgi:hypothetical protein
VAPALAERLARHAAAAGISETAVVEKALREHLDRTGDIPLILARLDRLGRAQERYERDQKLHAETFASFVKMWFTQTPMLPEDTRREALAAAEKRFGAFLRYVAQEVSRGVGFFDQFPYERVASDEDLEPVKQPIPRDAGTRGTGK